MSTAMEELPVSPIKPSSSNENDSNQANGPPSPLETEVDVDDEGGPSSVEAQADPSDLSFDLDLDLPTPSYPLVSPQPSTSNDLLNGGDTVENNPFEDLFNPSNHDTLEPDVKVEGAKAGVCGFYNFANTCYMNSGLQCLLATPTLVKYFTEYEGPSKDTSESDNGQENMSILPDFQPLLRDVWAGDYNLLKPIHFKESLSKAHPQFSGAHHHDCQEFLALLLGSMHEDLRLVKGYGKNAKFLVESECGTSMELHTAHSTEKDNNAAMSWLSRNSSLDHEVHANGKRVNGNPNLDLNDGTESRGSASPKSYDSRSSVEDKVATAIRQLPIPKTLKVKNKPGSQGSCSGDDESMEDDMSYIHDDEDTMDSSNSSNQPQPTSNLVNPDSLKRSHATNIGNVRSSNDSDEPNQPSVINNCNAGDNKSISNEDYLQKEAKTLNVNVLVEESEEMNNEISFDSEKYAKADAKVRPRGTIENNLSVNSSKRMKNQESLIVEDSHNESQVTDDGIKRIRLDSQDKEKNIQLEMERSTSSGLPPQQASALMPTSPTLDPARLKEAIEADRHWDKYLAINDTVLARTFQGQFKSSVVCKTCHYVSVSFEPFMYLPVPLPNANIRQVQVTYVDPSDSNYIQLRLDMCQSDNVGHLKSKLMEDLNLNIGEVKLQIAEVYDHHISRVIDDWTLLKCMREERQIYAFKIQEYAKPTQSVDSNNTDDIDMKDEESPGSNNVAQALQSCVICMEDLPGNELKQHNACDCVMCAPCLERTIEHHLSDETITKDYIRCPGCRQEAEPEIEFVSLDQIGKSKPKLRMFSLPVLSRRWDPALARYVTFGHPAMVHLPNQISARELFQVVKPFMPYEDKCCAKLALVNAQGKLCSRCIFNSNCFGCMQILEDNADQEVLLQINDTIAVTYDQVPDDVEVKISLVQHESMARPRIKDQLSLDDCLEAFSRTEELDETNPWDCPMCRKKKCATKTLTVWRFPDYLIIYLKRFVFTNSGALKLEKDVTFKVNELDLTPYLSGPLQSDSKPVFDLYGCVCHFGCAYGGHYTAFAKHLGTDQWNYFNDNCIQESRCPGDNSDDFSSAYILFYQRSGSKHENSIPVLSRKCRAFALDNSSTIVNNEKIADIESESEVKNHQRKASDDLEDLDDEAHKPDLSQIIRSLDTPPPS